MFHNGLSPTATIMLADTNQTETIIDDKDSLDDLPLARLIGSASTRTEYVAIDDDVPTCKEVTNESIVDDIISARPTTSMHDTKDDDDNDKQTDDTHVEHPSVDMAISACETLRAYLQGQPGLDDMIGRLSDIDRCISKIDLSRCCAKQALITNFFRAVQR